MRERVKVEWVTLAKRIYLTYRSSRWANRLFAQTPQPTYYGSLGILTVCPPDSEELSGRSCDALKQ
jgi:hypothetical protein